MTLNFHFEYQILRIHRHMKRIDSVQSAVRHYSVNTECILELQLDEKFQHSAPDRVCTAVPTES